MPDITPNWKALVRARVRDLDPDVLDEIAEHADEIYRDRLARGATHDEACRAVERELEDVPAVARAARASRRRRLAPAPAPSPAHRSPIPAFLGDLRYAVRLLAARPAVTATVAVTLALGIGVNTALFGIVHRVLLAPLTFPEPDRLVMLWEQDAQNPQRQSIVAAPNWQDWTSRSTSFAHTTIWEFQRFNLSGDGEPEQVFGLRVSSGVFPMLGLAPQAGRVFTAAEDAPGHDVVVISDALWRRRFGGAAATIGRPLRINGRVYEIVGVMPPSFIFPTAREQVWVPIAFNEHDAGRNSQSFFAAARIRTA
jgi:hypothetical protein